MSERDLIDVIEASRVFRVVANGARSLAAIAQASTAAGVARDVLTWWRQAGRRRWHVPGIAMLVAGAVHISVVATQSPNGWLWLVVPVWAMVMGAMFILMSFTPSRESGS